MQSKFVSITVDERREMVQWIAEQTDDEIRATFSSLHPPEGSAKDVLAWVNDDPRRAAIALDVEETGRNRGSLKTALKKIVAHG